MGMASVFYDVLNYLVIDSCIHPSGYSERACASKHVQHATQNDLVKRINVGKLRVRLRIKAVCERRYL
jgi:hypothetical protein